MPQPQKCPQCGSYDVAFEISHPHGTFACRQCLYRWDRKIEDEPEEEEGTPTRPLPDDSSNVPALGSFETPASSVPDVGPDFVGGEGNFGGAGASGDWKPEE
jgi:uncharacterized membrane protein YgcG